MQLDQVKAIITGGASGLGNAVAQHFVANGGKVALFDVNEDKGNAAAKALGEAARFFRTDVTSEDGVATNVAAAHHAMGGLNVVINCAGILGAGRVLGKEGPMPPPTSWPGAPRAGPSPWSCGPRTSSPSTGPSTGRPRSRCCPASPAGSGRPWWSA